MDKAKQLMIALICGVSADHELVKNALSGPGVADAVRRGVKIGREDLFAVAGTGKSLFEYKEVWDNLGKLIETVRADTGDQINGPEFLRTVREGNTPFEYVRSQAATELLFSYDLWKGFEKEMVSAWYRVGSGYRREEYLLDLRRKIAAAEGRTLREDQLATAGITIDELRKTVASGDFSAVREKLAARGDHLRTQDLFILDAHGDHMLDTPGKMENFSKLWAELSSHGETVTLADFTRRQNSRQSAFEIASRSHDILRKIFNAQVWRGRPAEMLELYNGHMPKDKRKDITLEDLLEDVAQAEHGSEFAVGPALTKEQLSEVVNEKHRESLGDHFAPVLGLGLERVWTSMPDVRKALEQKGQRITLSDLRQESGFHGESCLLQATRYGQFDEVLSILAASGEKLTPQDLIGKRPGRDSVLDILVDYHMHDLALKPELWVGRPAEFVEVWQALPHNVRKDMDFENAYAQVNMATLRSKYGRTGPSFG